MAAKKPEKWRAKPRRNITLRPETDALLDACDNASEYVDNIVRRRAQDVAHSFGVLRSAEWRPALLLAYVDVANGHWLTGGPSELAASMVDAVDDGICEKWRCSRSAWRAACTQVADDSAVAAAAWTIASDFWDGNQRSITVTVDRFLKGQEDETEKK